MSRFIIKLWNTETIQLGLYFKIFISIYLMSQEETLLHKILMKSARSFSNQQNIDKSLR